MANTKTHQWGYSSKEGAHTPDKWADLYPVGERQSPIDIRLSACTCCNSSSSSSSDSWPNTNGRRNGGRLVGERDDTDHQLSRALGDQLRLPERYKRRLNSLGERPDSPENSNSSGRCSASSIASSTEYAAHSPGELTKLRSLHYHHHHCQNTRFCATNRKLYVGYPRFLAHFQLQNTGHSWQVSLEPEIAAHTLLAGPPLGDREYQLLQVHCHWGRDCDSGSEHLIDGRAYSAEIHFVHWCRSHFRSAKEASSSRHGLAVIAVLVEALEGDESNRNKHLEQVVDKLQQVSNLGGGPAKMIEGARLDLKKLLPANRWHYATYEGSLTTPPLSEVVDWIVLLNPITCSRGQIDCFRRLSCSSPDAGQLVENCRPIQPHNGRQVTIWSRNGQHN